MNNTTFLLLTFFLPWILVFFIKRNEIARFMEVTWLTIVMNVLLYDCGLTLNLWTIKENAFPFHVLPPFFFGLYPVLTIYILKYSFGRFWRYLTLNIISDILFSFVFLPWLVSRGVHGYVHYPVVLILALSQAIIIYVYQLIREETFLKPTKA